MIANKKNTTWLLLMLSSLSLMSQGVVKNITYSEFVQKVWNIDENKDTFTSISKVPIIIDFYADWCAPCRELAPRLKKIQEEYGDAIQVYKVNTEKEQKLADVFGISGLPSLLFIPTDSEPFGRMGLQTEAELKEIITNQFKVQKIE